MNADFNSDLPKVRSRLPVTPFSGTSPQKGQTTEWLPKNSSNEVRSALFSLDAGCERSEWVRALTAAKAAGLTLEDADDWSRTGANYKGSHDVKTVWRSLKEDGGITGKTLFYMAQWHDGKKQHSAPVPSPVRPPSGQTCNARQVSPATKPIQTPEAIWVRCMPATAEHGYIKRKTGIVDGLRIYPASAPQLTIARQDMAGYLVVPCHSIDGSLQSLQFIPPGAGRKLNLPGSVMAGGFHVVGEIPADGDGALYITEGISAAWAAWKATGQPSVASFGWGNVRRVAEGLHKFYPAQQLVLLPDVGKESAAADIAGGIPDCGWVSLPEGMEPNTDVGDFAEAYDLDVLEELLLDGVQYPAPAPLVKEEPRRYRPVAAADILSMPPMRWLIRHVFPEQGIAAVFGASGSGKSFLMLDMAATLAMGMPAWHGHKAKGCPVAYVVLEGAAGLRNRLAAWCEANQLPIPDGLHFFPLDDFNLMNKSDAQELAVSIVECCGTGCMVVIDTLAQAMPGGDENSSKDMGLAIHGMKLIQTITAGLVVAVHHTGKNTSAGMRGHSSLRGALDAAIEVSREGEHRTWKVEKSKEGRDGDSHAFRLQAVDLGQDDEGEPVSSCVIARDSHHPSHHHRQILTKASHKAALAKLSEMLKASSQRGCEGALHDRPCIRLGDFTEAIKPLMECAREKDQGTYAQRAITALRNGGHLDCDSGWVWMC